MRNFKKYLKTRHKDFFLGVCTYLLNNLYILYNKSLPSEWMTAYQESYKYYGR